MRDASTHGDLLIVSVPKTEYRRTNAGKMRGMDYIIDRYWAGGLGGQSFLFGRVINIQSRVRLV